MRRKVAYVAMGNDVILNNEISNKRKKIEYTAKERSGKCFMCEFVRKYGRRTMGTGTGTKRIETPSHVRGVHICEYHEKVRNCLLSYGFEFKATSGKPTAKGISNSIEFETKRNKLQGFAVMVADYNFAPTSDCTVECEYKSPIYLSLQGMIKALGGIEYCIKKKYFVVNDDCGTHLHTSIYSGIDENGKPIPKYDYTLLGENSVYKALFYPTCEYLSTLSNEKMLAYFGSNFRYYAINPAIRYPDTSVNFTCIHETIFNVQHNYSLEFRLPRFVNAVQYRNIVLYMQEVVTIVSEYQNNEKTAQACGLDILETTKHYFES